LILNYFREQCNDLSRQPWQNRDKTPGRAQNRLKIQDSAISVSYDRRHRKADSSKQNLAGATGIFCEADWRQAHDSVGCRSLDEHLLFEALKTRGTGQTEGSTNLTTGPRRQWTASANKSAFISAEAESTGALI